MGHLLAGVRNIYTRESIQYRPRFYTCHVRNSMLLESTKRKKSNKVRECEQVLTVEVHVDKDLRTVSITIDGMKQG